MTNKEKNFVKAVFQNKHVHEIVKNKKKPKSN